MDPLARLSSLFAQVEGPPAGQDPAVAAEARRRDELQFARSIALDYVDLYKNAPSAAHQRYYRSILEQVSGQLAPKDRAVLAPIVRGTPLDPEVQKAEFFERNYGKRPQYTAVYKDNPMLFAQSLFAAQEYDIAKAQFMTNEKRELQRIVGLPDGQFAVKEGGVVSILTAEELKAKGKTGPYDVSVGEIVMNNGEIRGKGYKKVLDGVEYDVIPRRDVLKNKELEPVTQKSTFQLGVDASKEKVTPKQFNEDQHKIIDAFGLGGKVGGKLHPLWEAFEKKVLSGDMDQKEFAIRFLGHHFNGFVPVFRGLEKDKSYVEDWTGGAWNPGDNLAINEKFQLKIVPGKRAVFMDKGKVAKRIIVDYANGLVFDEDGVEIGDPEALQKVYGDPIYGDKLWLD
jgi:co-chaperonin GroES (HSP10)